MRIFGLVPTVLWKHTFIWVPPLMAFKDLYPAFDETTLVRIKSRLTPAHNMQLFLPSLKEELNLMRLSLVLFSAD